MNPRKTLATEPKSSPWKQPIMWLVVGLPAVVVIAGIVMIVVAGGSDAIDTSPDQVQRMAQIQTIDLGPDQFAAGEKLSAIVRVDPEQKLVEVLPVNGTFDHSAPLQLDLLHPTDQAQDRHLLLQPTELGWRIGGGIDGHHDWNVRLGPVDAHWRLQGRLPKDQLATNLRPRLQAQ
ncbi:MAG: FixH family protein [Pseudoxanthomonas sp.]